MYLEFSIFVALKILHNNMYFLNLSKYNLLLFLIIVIFSCNENNSNTVSVVPKNKDSNSILKNSDKLVEKDFDALGFDLMEKETLGTLKLGLKLSELKNILGEPNIIKENVLWDADGEFHQTIIYSNYGIELDMMGKKEMDKIINMITVESPCEYKTGRGVAIGSNYQDVEKLYKDYINPTFSDNEIIIAGSVYGGVIFKFEKEKVKSIFIGASAE